MKKILAVAAMAIAAAFLPDSAKATTGNHNELGIGEPTCGSLMPF